MMTLEAYKDSLPDLVQRDPRGTEFLVLRVEDRLTLGLPGVRAGGSIFFDAEPGIGSTIPIHWKDSALFSGPIVVGQPMQVRDDATPGFYRFGIAGQADFPFGIGVDADGRAGSAYMVYKDVTGLLHLRVFAFVSQNNPVVTFRADFDLKVNIEIVELSVNGGVVCNLGRRKRSGIWRIEPDRLGRFVILVRLKRHYFDQMGGGEEAEVEIVPPDMLLH